MSAFELFVKVDQNEQSRKIYDVIIIILFFCLAYFKHVFDYWNIATNRYNPCQSSVKFYIKTSHLICTVNQMTGFYMKWNTELKWIKTNVPIK